MISKKIRALSAALAAVMAFSAIPASAHTHINGLSADYTKNVRLNKPYMNFMIKAGADVDVTNMKFAIKDKNGKKVATFTGGGDSLTILDNSLHDFTNIHSVEDLKNYPDKSKIPVDKFTLDLSKITSPNGDLYNSKKKIMMGGNTEIEIRPYDEYYYYYNDTNKYNVVERITLPANTGFVDISSKFVDLNNHSSDFSIKSEEGLKCDIMGAYNFYTHAGTRARFKGDTGRYKLYSAGGWSGEMLEIYDHPVSYSKVRMKFNDAFPGLADSDLKITKNYDFGENDKFTLVYDLRGDQSKNAFTAVYYSGSVISAPIPDKNGYVEFWMKDDDQYAQMGYDFTFIRTTSDGRTSYGGGGGSHRTANLPRSIEDINFVFEYPRTGFCLYGLSPEDYKIVIDDKGDSRDYRLNRDTLTITDSKEIQRYTITVNKRPLLLGDCNRDGVINVTDIAIIAAHVKGVKKLDGRGPLTADVNESNIINITDVSTISAHVKGKKFIPEKWV